MKIQRNTKRDGYYLIQAAIWLVILAVAWVAINKFNILNN